LKSDKQIVLMIQAAIRLEIWAFWDGVACDLPDQPVEEGCSSLTA